MCGQVIAKRVHKWLCDDVLSWVSFKLPFGMSSSDQKEALAEVRAAIAKLPVGASQSDMEAARDRVVSWVKKDYEAQKRIDALVERGVGEIYPYVKALVEKDRMELDDDETVYSLAESLKKAVREGLEDELEANESQDGLKKLVHALIREELGF